MRALANASIVALLGMFIGLVPLSLHEGAGKLVEFSANARALAAAHGIKEVALPRARDEGLLLYFDTRQFADRNDVFARWKSGAPMALVLSDRNAKEHAAELGRVRAALDSGPLRDKNEKRYYLFLRN